MPWIHELLGFSNFLPRNPHDQSGQGFSSGSSTLHTRSDRSTWGSSTSGEISGSACWCWAISARFHDPYDFIWFDKRIDDALVQIYIIYHNFCVNVRAPLYTMLVFAMREATWNHHEHLWIAYEYDHVSAMLRSRLAVRQELQNPPSFLWARTFQGKSGRDMSREDPFKRS